MGWISDIRNEVKRLDRSRKALRKFGRSLLKAKQEVLNFCKYRITTGPLEAFNNTVSRIIHRACGMQNLDYLFLKLRQESIESHLQK